MVRKFGMLFVWCLMLVQGVLGFLLEALGIFWGFDFCPHSIAPVTSLKSSVPRLGQKPEWLRVMILVFSMLVIAPSVAFSWFFSILTCIVLTFWVAYFVRVYVCVSVRLYLSILFIYFLVLLLVCMPRLLYCSSYPKVYCDWLTECQGLRGFQTNNIVHMVSRLFRLVHNFRACGESAGFKRCEDFKRYKGFKRCKDFKR